jgi:hypothetical protein
MWTQQGHLLLIILLFRGTYGQAAAAFRMLLRTRMLRLGCRHLRRIVEQITEA